MRRFWWWLPIVALYCAFPGMGLAQDLWTLTSADFQSRAVGLTALDASGLTLMEGGSSRQISWDSVLQLTHGVASPSAPGDFVLRLNGGDAVSGFPVSVANNTVTWEQSSLGKFEISEDRINAIVRSGKATDGLDDARPADIIRLANGDSVSGVIQQIASGVVTIQTLGADSPTPVALDKVDAILFADSSPLAVPPGRAFRVTFDDGSTLTFPSISLAGDRLTLDFPSHAEQQVELKSVSSIEQINGPVMWLTALKPQILYRPFLTEYFPPRFDHPVAEPDVTIAEKYPLFHHGIGVHAYTKLTYAIPAGYETFRAQYAIDTIPDSDSDKADVTVRVYLDGQAVRVIPHVRAGPIAAPLSIDLGGAKTLSLEVDYGDNLAAQARFVWLDPAFIQTAAVTEQAAPSTEPQ
ncbi:MAG TPA: NPCBM/NEW2 domain-containing protein [Tepidisphaeraceae bacterium]|nr:NPCBM/NEW2 domain-containing protein [Tepidisphaeraceae bacterium]